MATFTPDQIAHVDIYPPIGVARVGGSPEWYHGPEVPGVEPMPEGGFKDRNFDIKKVSCRYRVYAFDSAGNVLGELTPRIGYTVNWKIIVANKKSAWVRFRGQYQPETYTLRNPNVQGWPEGYDPKEHDAAENYAYTNTRDKLIAQSPEVTVSGANATTVNLDGSFYGSKDTPTRVHMGSCHTDNDGRLVVLAGDGLSFEIHTDGRPENQPWQNDTFNNDDWVDSMCDGHINASVAGPNGFTMAAKNKATIITAPPRFAHGHQMPTSLYDLIEDVYERQKRARPGYDVGNVNYYRDIHPLFHRMYVNSWTNFRANEGHGPRKAEYFLNNPDLYDPNTNNPSIRQYIFGRMRAPVIKGDPANEALRDTQKNPYYMPRLGGNDGDMPEVPADTRNNRDRWVSLTELQMDRLRKWSEGNFETGHPIVPYDSFDNIPLQEQPHALTHAALEWSVGAPLYPGIECYWAAEFDDHWDLTQPFRVSDSVTPGDLGKGLALPWQADFFMCNTHWWPSVRPDNIVTEEYFNQVRQNFATQPENIAMNLTTRIRWDDGIDRRPEMEDERWGNSDLTRKWFKLGFIAKQEYGLPPSAAPVHIEKERNPDLPHTEFDEKFPPPLR